MTTLLGLLAIAAVLGLRRRRFDLVSFCVLGVVVLAVVVTEHQHALFGEITVQ